MASKKALSDRQFSMLKSVVSAWYDSHGYLPLLKVLFRDNVPIAMLSQYTSTIGLLNALDARGCLSSENLTLVHDTIKTTQNFGLLKKIRENVPAFPDVKEGPIITFTIHRQQLMKFGMKLQSGYIENIDGFYNSPLKKYTDGWSMISDLEDRLVISDENMEEFIDTLKRLNVPLAVNALTEGIGSKKKRLNSDSSDQPEAKRARTTPKYDLTTNLIDSTGGQLELANIKLLIPKGAISYGETIVEMSLGHVTRESYEIPVSNKLESRISPIVTCRPSGTVFKKPCSLSFPHNAVNEEWWKFAVLVGDSSRGTWKRTEGDDQYNISVRQGRCYIETKYFSDFTLLGLITSPLYSKRSLNLGLFGKHIHPQTYLLKVRIWNEYDNKLVLEDENKREEKKLDVFPPMFAMYGDMYITIDNLNNGLHVEGDTTVKLEAPLLWSSNPSHEFQLKMKGTSIRDLHAKISTTQGSGHIHERPLHTRLNPDHRTAPSATNTPHTSST